MKLRIQGSTLRLRLSAADVRRLAETGVVTETMPVAPGVALAFVLRTAETDALGVTLADHVLTVSVPQSLVGPWAEGDAVGLGGSVDAGDGRTLAVVVEKDLG